jgi:hypothetical protein
VSAARYTVSMGMGVMGMMDTMAAEDDMTRSGLLAFLARQEWRRRQEDEQRHDRASAAPAVPYRETV